MTFKSKTDRNIVIALITFLIIFITFPIIVILTPKEIDYVEYIKADLGKRYNTEFVYIKKEEDDSAYNGEAYYFYPKKDDTLIVRAYYYKSYGSGTMCIPFSWREGVVDDLEKKAVEMVCSKQDSIELSKISLEEATSKVNNLLDEIKRELNSYDISTDYYASAEVPIFVNGTKHKITYLFNYREDIEDELKVFYE